MAIAAQTIDGRDFLRTDTPIPPPETGPVAQAPAGPPVETMVRAIVITGSPGAGSRSVLEALSGLLDHDGVPHAAFESEQLGWGTLC